LESGGGGGRGSESLNVIPLYFSHECQSLNAMTVINLKAEIRGPGKGDNGGVNILGRGEM